MRRVKIATAAVWLVLSGVSVAFAFTGGESNPLDAKVLLVDTGIGYAFTVQNRSDEIWRDVRLQIPGGYEYRRAAVRPGERLTVEVRAFSREVGGRTVHPPRDLAPHTLTIVTREAHYTTRTRRGR